jgi:thiol-disulfide isomerase/thioredoxin
MHRTHRRTTLSLGTALATLVLLAAPVRHAAAQEAGIAVGTSAPAAAVQTLDGKSADLSQYVGKRPVVLEFWATWCPLCRKLEPAMQAARTAYGDRVAFVSVGVPQSQTPERQQAYVDEKHLGGEFVFDRDGKAIAAYKVPHTSFIVVIDGAGKVVYTGVGAEQDVDAAVRKALPASR